MTTRFSPKIEIINHFDNLINRVDIDIEECLEKYNNELLGEILMSSEENRRNFRRDETNDDFYVSLFHTFTSFKHEPFDLWTVTDYLKQVRMETIEELRKAHDETFDYYKLNSFRFKSELSVEKNIDKLKSQLYSEKFYFQVHFKQPEKRFWPFNLFTFVTDFYMSSSEIDSLE